MTTAAPAASHWVDLSDVSDLTIISLWKRIYSFLPDLLRANRFSMGGEKAIVNGMLVCKAFKEELPSLVKHISISRYNSSGSPQQQLKHIADTFTNLDSLDLSLEYHDHTPSLDFSKVRFPNLRSLSLYCAPIRSMEFTQQNTPKLDTLTMNNCQSVRAVKLDLPELESVVIEFLEVQDARGFGRSLSSCPKLKRFMAYKLWGLGGVKHQLKLPECDELSLHRSDDLDALEICAPQLHSLELRACYSLEWVRILPDPEGTTPTPLRVNLINANIDRVSKQHLKTHPRVKAPGGKYITKESQDEFASMFDEGGGMSGSEDEDSDDDDDDEGPMFGMEGFLQMMQMMGQEANLDPQIAAMMMQGGPFGMFAHDEADEADTDDEDEYETDSEGGAIDHGDNPDHDPDHQAAGGPGFPGGMAGMPAGLSAMLAMAMMNGMPVGMAMDGVHMMAAGYGNDSGSMDDDDELEEGTEDGDDDDDDDDAEENEAGGGPSCVIEEVE